jgi:hypothetical protein
MNRNAARPLIISALLLLIGHTSQLLAQTTETFETEGSASTSFTDNGQLFNITSQAQGPFDIQASFPGTGWNGSAPDNRYIDNDLYAVANVPVQFTIASSGAVGFRVSSFYLYLADNNANIAVTGSVTITGKRSGATQFTATASSGFNSNFGVNNGFSFIDLNSFGGSNNTNTVIDQLVIATGGRFAYVSLDAFKWRTAPAPSFSLNPSSITKCSGTSTTFSVTASNATSYAWQEFISSWNNLSNTGVYSGTTTTSLTISNTAGLDGRQYRCVATGTGSTNSSAATLTVTTLSNTLAGATGGSQVCVSQTISSVGTTYSDGSCQPLALVTPSGGSAVSGSVQTCVKIDGTVQSYNGQPFLQRHYDIVPTTNASTATGTITLYFTQQEFDNYNTARGSFPRLPNASSDAAGKSNLRITQYHGTGTAPGNYSGLSQLIDPTDANIVWNATTSQWSVTFTVSGFSGFFITTGSFTLPVRLKDFSVSPVTQGNLIKWSTADEENIDHYELQMGYDATNFATVHSINGSNSNSEKQYSYTDMSAVSLTCYYRLRIVELDGSFKYSSVLKVDNRKSGLQVRALAGSDNQVNVIVSVPRNGKVQITLSDMSGKLIVSRQNAFQAGEHAINLPTGNAGPGVYIITVNDGTEKKVIKFLK